MKLTLFLSLLCSIPVWAISPHEFNSALMEDMNKDIKEERYLEKSKSPLRGPASLERQEEKLELKEYQKKNRVNGLHEKW